MYPLLKESEQLYCELREVMATLIEQFAEKENADCERVHALFCRLAKQMEELDTSRCGARSAPAWRRRSRGEAGRSVSSFPVPSVRVLRGRGGMAGANLEENFGFQLF